MNATPSTYTVLGTESGYQRFDQFGWDNLSKAMEYVKEEETKGRKVQVVETCKSSGRRYGSQWTVYQTS